MTLFKGRQQKEREARRQTQRVNNNIGTAAVGYVVIPQGMDPDAYIEDCYRTNTITMWGGRGFGLFNSVYVSAQVMQDIQFPQNPEEINRGSAVIWVKDENSQLPVVIGTLSNADEILPHETNQFRLKRNINDKRAIEVFLDAKSAAMFVNITGDDEESADLNIKVTSENKDSVINVYSDSNINVSSGKNVTIDSADSIDVMVKEDGLRKTNIHLGVGSGVEATIQKRIGITITDDDREEVASISYEHETGFTYEDEYDNKVTCSDGEVTLNVAEDKAEFKYKKGDGFSYKDEHNNEILCKNGEIDLTSQKIVEKGNIQHNNGGEKMVKGDTLKNLLDQLCSQVSDICTAAMAITVTCGMPGSPSTPPVNMAQFASAQAQVNTIKSQLDTMLSQKSKLD